MTKENQLKILNFFQQEVNKDNIAPIRYKHDFSVFSDDDDNVFYFAPSYFYNKKDIPSEQQVIVIDPDNPDWKPQKDIYSVYTIEEEGQLLRISYYEDQD